MEDNKPPSMLERLENVLGSINPPTSNILSNRHHPEELYANYRNALDLYLKSFEISIPLEVYNALYHPFIFFYTDESKSKVYTIDYFPYGANGKSNILTRKTFPSFLRNICLIPYESSSLSDQLYHALSELILKYPYDRVGKIINLIKCYSPIFPILLNTLHFVLSENKNIYYDSSDLPSAFLPDALYNRNRYQSILKLPVPKEVPSKLMKQYILAILSNRFSAIYLHQTKNYHTDYVENIFSNSNHHALLAVRYSISSEQFTTYPLDLLDVLLPKHLPLSRNKTTSQIPEQVVSFFYLMCELNLPLIDEFSAFLSHAFSPTESGITILLSPQNKEFLKSKLVDILNPEVIAANGTSFSLNQITKTKYLKSLFLEQSNGASVVFVHDILPSSQNLPVLKRLLKGNSISIKSNTFPQQHYQNTMHFVCITSNRKRAKELQLQLKARLLDFSMSEVAIQEQTELSHAALHWFHSSLLLHGLKLRTYQSLGMAVPVYYGNDKVSYPTFEDSLCSFLQDYCEVVPDAFCSTNEIYERYTQYVAATQDGRTPEIQKRAFNSQLRLFLKKEHRYKNVVYKRNHVSRSSPSLWGYQGLKPASSFPSSSTPQTPTKEQQLREYLSAISQDEVEFKEIICAEISIPER